MAFTGSRWLRSHFRHATHTHCGLNPVAAAISTLFGPSRGRSPRAPQRPQMEALEPRLLLSADLPVDAAHAIADGFERLDARFADFVSADTNLGQRLPVVLSIRKEGTGNDQTLVREAPTIRDLFTVAVDANGDGQEPLFGPFDPTFDELQLKALDANSDKKVDAGEFLRGWFFQPVEDWLTDNAGSGTQTSDFVDFLKGSFFSNLDQKLDHLRDVQNSGIDVDFKVVDANVADTSDDPNAAVTFKAGFELSVTRFGTPIDLGTEADALKLLTFVGDLDGSSPPQLPTIAVTSKLGFAFEFGVLTGGKDPVHSSDFFVRKADPLSVTVSDTNDGGSVGFSPNLNIGFLGATISGGTIDFKAQIDAHLIDPDDPNVLGFTDAQRGTEQSSGIVTAANPVPNANLDHDAGFFLRFGNVGIATPVTVADNDASSLSSLKSDIEAALNDAGLGNLIDVSLVGAGNDTVRFSLKPALTNNPLGFANETLAADGIIVGGSTLEYGSDQTFLLSVGGALPKVVTVSFPDPSHTDIGLNDDQQASVPDLVAANPASGAPLSADANFTINVWQNDGSFDSVAVKLTNADTATVGSAADLALKIKAKLSGGPLDPLLDVTAGGDGRIHFHPISAAVSAVQVLAAADAAQSEIGLTDQSIVLLQLVGANAAIADLSEAANFRLELDDAGSVSSPLVQVPDNNRGSLSALAGDIQAQIDAAVGSGRIGVVASGGHILLYAQNTNIRSISVKTENQTIDDLVVDVNRGLAKAGLSGQVTASAAGSNLQLQSSSSKSLEITHTLTFDAGRTYAELCAPSFGDPVPPLFGASNAASSKVVFNLPVTILAGLNDATNPGTDWQPTNVAIVGNFDPFNISVAEYDANTSRFDLKLTVDPAPANPDPAPISVPSPSTLTDEIKLVNFAEPLNFSLISAQSMIGLVAGLGTALQQIANAAPFANYDIPFVDAKLSDLFNFANADKKVYSGLIDMLLYDTGGDGFGGAISDHDALVKKVTVNSQDKLVPAFTTAQKLADALSSVLGLEKTGANGINATYDRISNQLTYRVDLLAGPARSDDKTSPAPTKIKRFQYDVALNPFAKLTVNPLSLSGEDGNVDLNGRSGLQATLGVDLSPADALLFSTTKLSNLNDGKGIGIKPERAVTGTASVPVVPPSNPPGNPVQQLPSGDAQFSISINGGAAVTVTIPHTSTVNRSMADLVEDVNNALAAARDGSNNAVDISSQIKADFDGTRLVLSVRSPSSGPADTTTTFTLTQVNTAAASDLGLSAPLVANQADFVIHDRAGGVYKIVLDGLTSTATLQDLFNLIGTATGGKVTAELNSTRTGVRLVDHSGGGGELRAETINGSIALLRLGLYEQRDPDLKPLPDRIEGGGIGSKIDLNDRFFVRDGQMRIDGLSVANKEASNVAQSVPGQALFGIVGVDTRLTGSLQANVSAMLQNPTSKVPGSLVTLNELFAQKDVVATPDVSKVQHLDYSTLFGDFAVGTRIIGGMSKATAVVIGVDSGTLTLADVEGTFKNDEALAPISSHAPFVIDGKTVGTVSTNSHFADFTLDVHVQDGFAGLGFGNDIKTALDGKSYVVPVALTSFGAPGSPATPPTATVGLSGIGDLAFFQKLTYSNIESALNKLLKVIEDVNGNFALFNTKLPAINRSVSDLLGLVDGFATGVQNADNALDAATLALDPEAGSDMPALRLQDLAHALRGAFGLPVDTDPDAPDAVDWVKIEFDKTNDMLLFDLSLDQTVDTKLGLDIIVGGGIPDITSGGVLKVNGKLDVRLNFGIDLATPSNAYLFDTSNISASLKVQGEGQDYNGQAGLGLVFRASLQGLDVFIRDGGATIDIAFNLPGLNLAGGKKLISQVQFSDWKAPVIAKDLVDITLPMFYGGEGPNDFIGAFTAQGGINAGLTVVTPDFSGIASDIESNAVPFDPFSNILLAVDTLNVYLETLSDDVSNHVLGITLPFVGDQLADALFIEDFRSTLVRTLKNGIESAVNPNPDTIVQDLLHEALNALPAVQLVGNAIAYTNTANAPNAANRKREWNFKLKGSKNLEVDDFVLGIQNLGFDIDTPVSVKLDWQVGLGFGVDYIDGAYVVLPEGGDDIDVKLTLTLPGGTHPGLLGFLPVKVTGNGATEVKLDFDIDVTDGATTDPILAFSDVDNIEAAATLQGSGKSGSSQPLSLHLVTDPAPGLPVMSTDLVLKWELGPGTDVESLDGNAMAAGIEKIAYDKVVLDSGSVAERLLGPIFKDLADFIEPFMPVIDTLTTPVPILSDIAGEDITLLDLAAVFGSVDGEFIETVSEIFDVISAINSFLNAPDLPLGSLTLFDTDPAHPVSNFDPTDPGATLPFSLTGSTDGLTLDTSYDSIIDSNEFLKAIKDQTLAKGLTMPILTDQLEGFKLLLGDSTATLVNYELPPLNVDFSYRQLFPLVGPLGVSITISFGFGVALNSVGFDAFGYQRYAQGGFLNPGVIFDGFFFNDNDSGGVDTPEVRMEFGLVGAAELNLGAARAGVQGGIDALILFNWHDSIPDGHVHLSEIAGNIIDNGNPLAAFDVSGELSFFMSAFIEITLIGFHLDIPITGQQTLYKFEGADTRAPVLATDLGDGVLQLNMGPNAKDRLNGDTSDGNEYFNLKQTAPGEVKVWSDRLGVKEADGKVYKGVSHIVGLGGQGDDVIELEGFDGSNITAELDGGIGDDRIEYKGSSGSRSAPGAVIKGGLGNDILIGGDANDVIYGGQGNDVIKGGGGYDILFGDDGTVADTLTPSFLSARVKGTDGDDKIEGGAGDDVLFGAGGNDDLKGNAGNDILIGDGGRFNFTTVGGSLASGGHIDVNSLRPAPYVPPPVETTTPKTPEQISKDIDALYDVVAGEFVGTDLRLGGNDTLSGGDDDDLLIGGSGNDTLKGDDGADIILGGKGFDTVQGGAGNDTIFGGDQADTIDGNAGADVISGGNGNDFIHGNDGNDVMKGDAGADVMFGDAGDDQIFGLTEPDVLFGGIGDDLVIGGSGNDIIFGDDGLVGKLDPGGNASLNVIIGNGNPALATGAFKDGDSLTLDLVVTDVVAGDGNDILSGQSGDDIMLGGGGDDRFGGDVDPRLPGAGTRTPVGADVMIGDGGRVTFNERQYRSIETLVSPLALSFNDTMYGDNGNDYILGGQGSDFLFGGHGKFVTSGVVGAFRGSTDSDASDNDIIVADNGQMLFADKTRPANFGRLELVTTTDSGNATGGSDYAEGELGDDVIFGGVNANPLPDTLFGNAGNDVILGDNGLVDFDDNDVGRNLDTLDLIRSFTDGLGGVDQVSGNSGNDVLMGGTAGDFMYGDDASASAGALDGEDIMLGDNGDIFLIGTVGRLKVRVASMSTGTAVDLITTTDVSESTGGADVMSGNAGNDIVLGGVNNTGPDNLYGDIASPTSATIGVDGNDILLGDNGLLDFTYLADLDRMTLDLIRSAEDGRGGSDNLSGNKGLDVAIGGTGGDVIYGDDANFTAGSNDLSDILIGDNADIFLVAKGLTSGGDLKDVLGVAVQTIRTTDAAHPEYGGSDTISGNAGADIMLGGVQGDMMYGDRRTVTAATNASDGNDIMLGDSGALEWQSRGRFSEIVGIAIADNNPALAAKFGTSVQDLDLTTLDLITTEQPTNGGRDLMYGDNGRDVMLGGTDVDTMYGDTGSETDGVQSTSGGDLMFGDHGRLYPQFSALTSINSRNFFAIDIGSAAGGQGDRMWGEEGDDIMLGNQGDDRMWAGSGNDDMTGGSNVSGLFDELSAAGVIDATLKSPDNGMNDVMDGGSGDDAMAGDNAILWRRGDDLSPRFRALTQSAIYTTTETTITANVGAAIQSDPYDVVGRDIQLLDHSDPVEAAPLGRFGKDVMAGGSGNDTMFGELGDDLMQGDGSITVTQDVQPATRRIVVSDAAGPTGETLYFNVPEAAADGDDYMEGNGGRDLMYGGLGQDDMIGGSSSLFGLNSEDMRPDDSDTMFGGAGIRTARNDMGDATVDSTTNTVNTSSTGHARDADYMLGDNANIYRLVAGGASGTNPSDPKDVFLTFNYDNYGSLHLVPRAMQQLDYTLGGGDYNGGGYNSLGQATPTGKVADNGAADLLHGEGGDDVMFGMTGSDVMFGEGQDDDMVGGYGNDWISGGTGQDGVLGDDGLVLTSRNSSTLGESLYGISALLATDPDTKYSNGNVLDELITTPGTIQSAVINHAGDLKKTFDLVPFSYDKSWLGIDDEYPDNAGNVPFADDIIFGGLGSDWLHGGSGDDAISGAEALAAAYVPVYDGSGNAVGVMNLGYNAVGIANPLVSNPTGQNPGNVLAFNPIDANGQHLNNRFRAGEFRLYDEYDPLRKILLTNTGDLSKTGSGFDFLLNFNKDEGVIRPAGTVPKATGQQTTSYPQVDDDGGDAIFGDLGNDWLVGGTGRDNAYGGWGNDLINVDDNQETNGTLNDQPDTHPTYEDRAYGGAGRDVLIANTGGDRLIDWVGEYNSYLVPFAPFGQATVSRTLQPFLPEFLYALSKADGADPTRNAYLGDPRNGEPRGEMGLVLQKDQGWQDQTGAPADPQAGNIPGGKRDVLRSADFNDGTAQGFVAGSGNWTVTNGRLEVSPSVIGTDAVSLYYHDQVLPSYFEVTATINAVKPIAGYKANSYIVFDYFGPTDFKFAGIDISNNKIEIGQRTANGWEVKSSANMALKQDTDYNVLVALNGTTATLVVNNALSISFAFTPRRDADGFTYNLNAGMIGLGADNAKARIDNVNLQIVPPNITYTKTDDYSVAPILATGERGTWTLSSGRYSGTPASGQPYALASGNISVGASSMLKLETLVNPSSSAGVIFDRYSADDFKFAVASRATNQVLIGHYTLRQGWVVDAAVSRTIGTGDQKLTVTIKGSTVSVNLNGQAALGYVFNSLAVDGGYGLVARGGSASFDSLNVQTDDPSFAAKALLSAAGSRTPDQALSAPTASDLGGLTTEALRRWAASGQVSATALAGLVDVTIGTADLGGDLLGMTLGNTITVDDDAAGFGWFVDPTPSADEEFRIHAGGVLDATPASPAYGRFDLLTALAHELGHVLGYDEGTSIMTGLLMPGERVQRYEPESKPAGSSALVPAAQADADARAAAAPDILASHPVPAVTLNPPPVLDWTRAVELRPTQSDEPGAPDAGAGRWRVDFVTQLGQDEVERNPNVRLKIVINKAVKAGLSASSSIR